MYITELPEELKSKWQLITYLCSYYAHSNFLLAYSSALKGGFIPKHSMALYKSVYYGYYYFYYIIIIIIISQSCFQVEKKFWVERRLIHVYLKNGYKTEVSRSNNTRMV